MLRQLQHGLYHSKTSPQSTYLEHKPTVNGHVLLEGRDGRLNSGRIPPPPQPQPQHPLLFPEHIKTELQTLDEAKTEKRQQQFPSASAPGFRSVVPPVPARDRFPRPVVAKAPVSPEVVLDGACSRKGRKGTREKEVGTGGKNGFDLLRSLIPSLNQQNSSVKISKAALLHKGGDYLRQLSAERAALEEELASHRLKIEALNASLGELHKTMAAASGGSGAGVTSDTLGELEQMFDSHVFCCTHQNWKYWPYSLLMRPLLRSFQTSVDSSSFDELSRTSLNWLDQHLSLSRLRPGAVSALSELSRRTDLVERGSCDGLPDVAVAEAARGTRTGKRDA